MKRKLGRKNKYLSITIYIIILIALIDALAIVLYAGTKEEPVVEEPETPYYPGKTDPVKIEEMPIDNEIKIDKETGCTKDAVNKIKQQANNVKISYAPLIKDGGETESEDGEMVGVTYYLLEVIIENITPDMTLVVRDNLVPSNERTFTYADTQNGRVSFEPSITGSVVTYYVTIKSSTEFCGVQTVKKIAVEVPKVNNMYLYDMCEGKDYIKECSYFSWEDYEPSKVYNAILKADKTTSTTTTAATPNPGEENTTVPVGNETTTTTTKVADNNSKEENKKDKEEKGKFEFDNTMKTILAIGIMAIVVVIVGAYVITKKRG